LAYKEKTICDLFTLQHADKNVYLIPGLVFVHHRGDWPCKHRSE